MASWDWVSIAALGVSLAVALKGYLREPGLVSVGRLDELTRTIEALQARCEALEGERTDALKRHADCEGQLVALRHEMAWMRANMTLTPR